MFTSLLILLVAIVVILAIAYVLTRAVEILIPDTAIASLLRLLIGVFAFVAVIMYVIRAIPASGL